ncbi:DUF6924 domain-containing protein [Streptomyces zagrosensis]|uniref:DUF6924 domain-containing protein n=1 Tax=Streptomyces zagrosensis TaxID=1042984 RepID=A0A7W9QCF1_9ACTN|nr:hypothetical protein [Streptomyces zagrosensis]MBB5936442.1 hypothetical protein [Streptomyces zagrosensis]
MRRTNWPLLEGRTRPLKMKAWGDLDIMDPNAGKLPRERGFLAVEQDWLRIDAGSSSENPIVTLYAGDDPGAENGWEEVQEITVISTTGFLSLCDGGYEPLRKENLATAGVGPYLIRVHASDRTSHEKKPRFLIQVIPGERTGAASEPPAATIEDIAGPLLVRTSFEQPDEWTHLLLALEGCSEHYASITVIDNRAYAGFTVHEIQAQLRHDDKGWPHGILVLIADEQALVSADFPLLAVNSTPDDDDDPFRITLAAAGSFVVNMELGNTSFADWGRSTDTDGIYRGEHY